MGLPARLLHGHQAFLSINSGGQGNDLAGLVLRQNLIPAENAAIPSLHSVNNELALD